MRLGIRAKLVGTLLLAGLLPLALALGTILVGVVELRISSRGQLYRALAEQQAAHLSTLLGSQVELAQLVNGMPGTTEFLRQANRVPRLSQAEIDKIEAAWPLPGPTDGLLRDCLNNPLALRWQSVSRAQKRFAEVLITDDSGRLVAATNKTSDYFQADEEWWQRCYDNGKGRVLITDLGFDESAVSPSGKVGALVANLCLPIYDDDGLAPGGHKVIGVTKISLDAGWMLQQIELGVRSGGLPRATWLVRSDGKAVSAASPAPVAALPDEVTRKLREQPSGWVKSDQVPGYELIGFAAVEQSSIMDDAARRWHVVVATSLHEVVSSLYRLAWVIFLSGMAIIAACFVGGWVIARREIIRPLCTLEHAVNQLATGDRGFRLPAGRGRGEIFRDDELGRLARDFNVMADQLKDNLEQLEQADAVKHQFIDLASHELRTPVTYIVGVSQLAQRQDGAAGNPIMARIAAKAQRLNRIVENMFKLLGSGRFDRSLRAADVDVAALIKAVCQEHEPFLQERRQRWQVEIDPNLPVIRGEQDKVKDIVTNLVSNAIRFSPDGGVVGVRATRVDDSVEIAVTDSGPGISPQDLPNLFQPFFTGGGTSVHSSGEFQHMSRGMGLGLSVVKRFVELHGGAVAVETSPTGTTIRVRLPITPPVAK